MRTKFYIHIGVHKTGTKSIQHTLSGNRRVLLRHGINSLSGDPNHGPLLISLLADEPHRDSRNIRRHVDTPDKAAAYNASARQAVMRSLARNRSAKFIITGEGLSPRKPQEIERFKQMLAPYAADYRVIVYVRDPYEYANSASLQRLKNGGVLDMPEKKFPLPKYRRNLSRWIKAFGRDNVDIRVFDPKRFIGGDLMSDFLVAIGESPELAKKLNVLRANQSMSHEAALILSEANKTIPALIDGHANRARAFDLHAPVVDIKGEKFAINPEEYLKHEAVALAEIGWLNSILGEPAFGRTQPRPASTPRWSEETVASIKDEVSKLADALRRTGRRFFLPYIEQPPLPPGLEWLRDAYTGQDTNVTAAPKSPEFNDTTIRALGQFFNDVSLTLQHRKAEWDALRGSLLIWVSPRLAQDHHRNVVRMRPESARGQYRLSQALLLRGHYAQARRAAEAAVELAPRRVTFKLWLKLAVVAERRWHKPPRAAAEGAGPKPRHVRRARAKQRAERQAARSENAA
ncbi:MAG TPA: hypothetical protein VFK79_16070 [Xanthobacteraceae bacterium]|nr:hypothetical protein [Xanthobacteraceae bacterium]